MAHSLLDHQEPRVLKAAELRDGSQRRQPPTRQPYRSCGDAWRSQPTGPHLLQTCQLD